MDIRKKIAIFITAGIFLLTGIYFIFSFNKEENDYSSADIEVISDLPENSENSDNGTADDNNIIKEDLTTIRVLLSNDGSYYQTDVRISCDTDFNIDADGEILKCDAGTEVDITKLFDEKKSDELVVTPASSDGKITVLSMEKDEGSPCYRGSIYMYAGDKGIYLVNELSLEEYLYAVVSSEMPSSYETEALKAQAVCARTYAIKKMSEDKFVEFNADIDDTTSTQVYNNIGETEESVEAVEETAGIIMTSEGEPIDAYFFSTSCGTTCRNDDVWDGSKLAYLNDKLEAYGTDSDSSEEALMVKNDGSSLMISEGVLTSEEIFKQFINNEIYFDAIESEASLYRWSVTYSKEQMENTIYNGIYELLCENSCDMKISGNSGEEPLASDIGSTEELKEFLGEIKKIEVNERGYSGIIQNMVIYASNAEVYVENQLTIRKLFNPSDTEIVNQTGNVYTGWTMLPSAYFYIESSTDGSYTIYGGGFGHGVGMSQNGANELAAHGFDYEEILMHYFDGVNLENLNKTGFN